MPVVVTEPVVVPAPVVLLDVTFAASPVVLLPADVFVTLAALVVCAAPFEVVVPFEVVAPAAAVCVAVPVVVLPAVGVPLVPGSSLAGSLLQCRRARDVSETKKREGVRLSIAVLKGKRTESREYRLRKLVATLCRSNSCQGGRSGSHRAPSDRKPVAR